MLSSKLDKLNKKLNKKKKEGVSVKKGSRKKKCNFPWLKSETGKQVKAYMCFLTDTTDQSINFGKSVRKKKDFFAEHVYPKVCKKFPKLFKEIKKYYENKGRSLDKPHYYELLYARLVNCYEDGFLTKTNEHPLNSLNSEFKNSYLQFLQ